MLPSITHIAYFLPDSLILFPPFSSQRPIQKQTEVLGRVSLPTNKSKLSTLFFNEYPAATTCTFPFSLQLCLRQEFLPSVVVRQARVEDCDDLLPILQQNDVIQEQGDHHIARLIEGNVDLKSLVAEVDGQVVGFMRVSRKVDVALLLASYQLSMFQSLAPITGTTMAEGMEGNCFMVDMFCIEKEYTYHSMDFIRYTLQVWHDLEYCVMTLAPNKSETQLMRECSLVPSIDPAYDHQLYVTNRYGIQDFCTIRKARVDDLEAMERMATGLQGMECFHDCVNSQFGENPQMNSYVMVHSNQIVGVMVLEKCTEENAQALTDQFDIERFYDLKWNAIKNKYCLAKYILINPLFENQVRYALRELMRLEGINCVLFPRNTDSLDDNATKRIAIREFVPVRPRRMIQFPNNLRDGVPVPSLILHNLQVVTVPLIYEPRMVVNTRLVVLGGSDTGLSFLESLVYTSHLHFSNLTLVSSDGIPPVAPDAFVGSRNYTKSSLEQLAIEYYVNVLQDTVVEIHRENRVLTTKSGSLIPYEYLFLTPGQQYLYGKLGNILPPRMENVVNMNPCELERVNRLIKAVSEECGDICIYGRSLQAYQTAEYCLKQGIPGSKIHLVDPVKYSYLYDDSRIESLVLQHVDEASISHYQGYLIESTRHENGKITMAKFKNSQADTIEISCTLFLYADEKSVDPSTFQVLNDACLVFDNALVIDSKFRTNDKYIFGAGPITKYSIDTHTDWRQMYCNSAEVGRQLAWFILHLFDPTLDAKSYPKKLYQYRAAVKMAAQLPGGLKFYSFDIPKLPTWKVEVGSKDMVLEKEGEYSRIRVSPRGYVESFVYTGKREIPISNLECLFGHHEKYYNRLVARFDEGVIQDFISFFDETWALALFHDRLDELKESLQERAQEDVSIQDIIRSLSQLNDAISEKDAEGAYERFDKSKTRGDWNQQVFEYLLKTEVFKSYP